MFAITRKFAKVQLVRLLATKAKSSKVIEKVNPKAKRIKELQRKFTIDDGVPIYLKGGPRDKLLYQATLLGIAIGMLLSLEVLFRLIFPGQKPSAAPPPEA